MSFPEQQLEKLEKKGKKVNNYGGRREGSGRKKKQHLQGKFKAREELYKWIDERWDILMNALETTITPQDKDMLIYLLNQRIGKPAESVDITSNNETIGIPERFQEALNKFNSFLGDQI